MGQFSDRFLPRKVSKNELKARRIAIEIIRNSRSYPNGENDIEKLRYYLRKERSKYVQKDGGVWAIRYIQGIINDYDAKRST